VRLAKVAALVLGLALSAFSSALSAAPYIAQWPPRPGGSGAVSSVTSGGGCVTVSPTTGAVVITSTGCAGGGVTSAVAGTGIAVSSATGAVTFSLATVSDQRILGNVSGSTAAPIPLTSAQVATFLGSSFLIPGNNLSDIGSAATARTNLGLGTAATQASSAFEVPLTFSSGLTRTTNTITSNYATGLSGGQIVYGDTLTTGNLTLRPNFADSTTGRVIASGLGIQVPDGSQAHPSIRFTTNETGFYCVACNTELAFQFAGATNSHFFLDSFSANLSTQLTVGGSASAGYLINNTGNTGVDGGFVVNLANTGVVLTNGAANVASKVILNSLFGGGSTSFPNIGGLGFTSSSTALFPTAPTAVEWAITPASIASGASQALDLHKYDAITATFTGTVHDTLATGVNFISIAGPTYTNASASTIDIGATLALLGPVVAAGSQTITTPLTLWVEGGTARFDGSVDMRGAVIANNTTATVLGSVGPTGSHTTVQEWFQVAGTGGATRYVAGF
jgi:hypothetical protein